MMKKDLFFAVNGLTKKELIELYTKRLGLNYTLIPYPSTRDEAAIMIDVSEERVDLFFAAVNGAVPLYKANKLRLLGVTSPHRMPVSTYVIIRFSIAYKFFRCFVC